MASEFKNLTLERAKEAMDYSNSGLVVLTMHGRNDWEVYFPGSDYSMRGTRGDALKEILDVMDEAEVYAE